MIRGVTVKLSSLPSLRFWPEMTLKIGFKIDPDSRDTQSQGRYSVVKPDGSCVRKWRGSHLFEIKRGYYILLNLINIIDIRLEYTGKLNLFLLIS